MEEQGGLNLYFGFHNDPNDFIDTLGLSCYGVGVQTYKLGWNGGLGPLAWQLALQAQFSTKSCSTCCGKSDDTLDIGLLATAKLTGSTAGFNFGDIQFRAGIIASIAGQGSAAAEFKSDRCHNQGLTGSICVTGTAVGSIGGGVVGTVTIGHMIFSLGGDVMGSGSVSFTKCYKCQNDICSWGKTKVSLGADVSAHVYAFFVNGTFTLWSGSTSFDL
jgi:hypothetical protein